MGQMKHKFNWQGRS